MATVAVTAVFLDSFQGGDVTIGGMAVSNVTYDPDNDEVATWTTELTSTTVSDPWYARLEVPAGGSFSGPVTITWQLQKKDAGWTDVGSPQTTNRVLSGGAEEVYASTDGGNSGNHNWATEATTAGTYRVVASIASA